MDPNGVLIPVTLFSTEAIPLALGKTFQEDLVISLVHLMVQSGVLLNQIRSTQESEMLTREAGRTFQDA